MVTVPEQLQTLLVQFEQQAGTVCNWGFTLLNIYGTFTPASAVCMRIMSSVRFRRPPQFQSLDSGLRGCCFRIRPLLSSFMLVFLWEGSTFP